MFNYRHSVSDYHNEHQEPWKSTSRAEQIEQTNENLNGIHMLITLLQEKVLQNEQEISHLQRIIWKFERENDYFRERILRLEATVTEFWQSSTSSASTDSGTFSEMSSELYEDHDPNDITDGQNGMYPHHNWASVAVEHTFPEYEALNSQLYWASTQPILCYFCGVPVVPAAFVNNETVPLGEQETTNSTYFYNNAYNV